MSSQAGIKWRAVSCEPYTAFGSLCFGRSPATWSRTQRYRYGKPGDPRSQNRNLGPPDLWYHTWNWLIPAVGALPPAGSSYRLCSAGGGWRENLRQLASVRRAKAGAGVPAWSRRIGAVVALGDIVEAVLGVLVEREIGEAYIAAALLVEQGDQRGPQRGDCAGPAYNLRLPIEQNVVTSLGSSIAGHVG